MTWDEKMLNLLSETENGPCGSEHGWGWKYDHAIYSDKAGVTVLWRYWLKNDGGIHRWVKGRDTWADVKSPRMRKVLELAAWPRWEPNN